MRLVKGFASLSLASLLAASAAQAYTPESGIWWKRHDEYASKV